MPSAAGTVFTDEQIAAVAKAAGFSGQALVTAVAVAIAESSGRTQVVNYLGCVGLWQIYQKMHPKWSTAQLKDPAINAQAAFSISNGGKNWGPWTTYPNASGRYMARAGKAVEKLLKKAGAGNGTGGEVQTPNETVTEAAPAGGSLLNPLGGVEAAVDRFSEFMRKAALSYVVLLVALVLLILGVVILSRRQLGTAARVVPMGKAGTIIKAVT
jgi:hypothetical protein